MHWKRFQPLVFSSLPETSKVETTQSCDPFAVALLPAHVPATLDALPEEDRLEAAERELCEQNIEITLTPEMIEAEFPLLDSKDTKKEKQIREVRDQAPPTEKAGEKVLEEMNSLRAKALNPHLILE
nr:cilia- and flagella-associated protein 221-like isoform X3 [Equus asinus]